MENLPYSWPLQSRLCLQLISAIIAPGRFLRAAVIDSPTGLVTLEVPVSAGAKVVVTGNVHRAAALLHAHLRFRLEQERSGQSASWAVN